MLPRGSFRSSFLLACLFCCFIILPLPSYAEKDKEQNKELEDITTSIKDKNAKWEAKETSVSKLSSQEKKDKLEKSIAVITGQEKTLNAAAANLPLAVDWRDYAAGNYVTPVKDQGACGSCWAFATAAALESATLISGNTPGATLDLSPQTALSCSGAGTCSGGLIDSVSIIRLYHDRAKIENTFRITQSDLFVKMDSAVHWTDSKIWVHALTCMIALLLVKLSYRRAMLNGYDKGIEIGSCAA